MGKASGKPFSLFLFTSWAYQIRNENSDAQKKQKTKQEARHNQTRILFNQNPDSNFDFKKNQDSIKKFRITIKKRKSKSHIKKP